MRYSNGKKYDQQMDNPYVQLWYEMVEHYVMCLGDTFSLCNDFGNHLYIIFEKRSLPITAF